MFCKNCGNEVKDTEKFCAVCGTPIEAAPVQSASKEPASDGSVKANVEKVTEAASQAAGSVAKKAQELGEKGKDTWKKASGEGGALTKLLSGKNKIWLLICVAVLVVAIPCIANAARLNNLLHKTFSSPAKYFQFVGKKELDEAADLAGGYYSDIVSRLALYDTSYRAEFAIEPGEEMQQLIKLADMFIDLDDIGIDLSELKSLKVGADVSVKDSVMGYGLTTAVNKVNLLSANVVMDMEQGEMYLQIPELTKTYMGVELGDYIGDTDELLESQALNRELVKALPKQAEVEKLVRRYLTIALEHVEDVSIGRKKELKVEGIAQKCTELKVTIDGETMQKVLEAVLEEAQGDRNLEKIIVAVADAGGLDGDEIYDHFMEEIEYRLDHIDGLADDDRELKLTVYVDGKGNIIGIAGEWEDSWYGKCSVSALTARKGSNIAYEITNNQYGTKSLVLSGKGKKSGNLLTGDFEVKVYGESALDLKVSGLDMEKLKSGYLNGRIEIALSSSLSKELTDGIGIPALSSLIKKSSFLLDCKSSSNVVDCKATLKYDEGDILGVSLALKSGNGSKTSVPNSSSVIMIEDQDDIEDYYDEIDWNKFLNGLEKTGVLAEAAEKLEDVIDELDTLVGAIRYIW